MRMIDADKLIAKLKADYNSCYVGGDYLDALEDVEKAVDELTKPMEPVRAYTCDPEKNKECKKTACYAKGGECRLTLNPNYAKEE